MSGCVLVFSEPMDRNTTPSSLPSARAFPQRCSVRLTPRCIAPWGADTIVAASKRPVTLYKTAVPTVALLSRHCLVQSVSFSSSVSDKSKEARAADQDSGPRAEGHGDAWKFSRCGQQLSSQEQRSRLMTSGPWSCGVTSWLKPFAAKLLDSCHMGLQRPARYRRFEQMPTAPRQCSWRRTMLCFAP
ncbi:hypothetical protein BDV96DRAFT_241000 [Lophiotrema nucula]|uniref:Uncharacterized protein n=1 Tax=Lophiotrema nucula TaxID=690887 RepID=A0A6A5YPX6_9PLEO|nr:hypothetical protein BDV96DRAFT_241000 [Lophiotrema nucula]